MTFLELVHLLCVSISLMCVVMHMNSMSWKTLSKLDAIAWWCLGIGLFGELFWQVYWWVRDVAYYVSDEHAVLVIGVSLVTIQYSQPEWRPFVANRRKDPEPQLPPDCDRRCQHFLNIREDRHKRGTHVPS